MNSYDRTWGLYSAFMRQRRFKRWKWVSVYTSEVRENEIFSTRYGKRDAPLFVQGEKAPLGTGDIHVSRKPRKYFTQARSEKRDPPEGATSSYTLHRCLFKVPNKYVCTIPWRVL